MTSTFQKPENALKRAEELVSVGQQAEALNVLHTTICHKKLKSLGWDHNTELMMLRHIRLCVDLEKLKLAREGLHFYRHITHQHNVMAFLKAMRELRDLSEAKLEAVKSRIDEAAASADVVVEDLEAEETPESLMLSTLQVEVRDKSAKDLHTALLGCWESYKIILDLLRYAPRIDHFYHDTAQKALEFCLKNNRTQEFRRLCETLRTHYTNFLKQRGRPEFESFCRPENHLSTRLTQLSVAAELDLWSQCFQTAEDILGLGLHDLLQRSLSDKDAALHKHKGLLLALTSMFYEKLAMIFRVSDEPVFHASAVLRNLFHTRQHKKTVAREEQIRWCDIGTLAVLCVPITEQPGQTTAILDYQRKLASMLGHGGIPTRASMKSVIEAQGVVASASPAVQALFRLVEGEVDPLTVCKSTLEHIAEIQGSPSLAPYIPSLKKVIFDKLILKLTNIYTSISISFFSTSLCPPDFIPWGEAESIIVQLVHRGIVQLRLDYSREAILFGSATSAPDSLLRSRLIQIARVLSNLVPQMNISSWKDKATLTKEQFYTHFESKVAIETQRLKNRNSTVAERRKKQEADEQAKEAARRTKEKEKQKKEEQEEQVRREAALRLQEDMRRREEQRQTKYQLSKQILQEFKIVAEKANGKIFIKGRSIEDITLDDIANRLIEFEDYEKAEEELRNRERQEKGRQRRLETKRVEHLVRALREEEAPCLDDWNKQVAMHDSEFLEKVQKEEEKEKRAAWEAAQELRQIFIDVRKYKDQWYQKHMEAREKNWEQNKKDRLSRINQVLKQRKIHRARERYQKEAERLRLEEEQRQKEAEERRIQEELERKRAQDEKDAELERERQEQLSRAAEKRRQKEMEIEERERREKEEREQNFRSSGGRRDVGGSQIQAAPGDDFDWRCRDQKTAAQSTRQMRKVDEPRRNGPDEGAWRSAAAQPPRVVPSRGSDRRENIRRSETATDQMRRRQDNWNSTHESHPARESNRGNNELSRGSNNTSVDLSRDNMTQRGSQQQQQPQAARPRRQPEAPQQSGVETVDDGFTTVPTKNRRGARK